jgi:hypothetical protein
MLIFLPPIWLFGYYVHVFKGNSIFRRQLRKDLLLATGSPSELNL